MADETDPNNPPQEVVPQPPEPQYPDGDTLIARGMVFPGVVALYPAKSEKELVAKTCEIVAALRAQPIP